MTTWETLRGELREELKDPNATKWSHDLLYIYIKDAVRDYSMYFPRRFNRVEIEFDTDAYTLPEDYKEDILVEVPLGNFLKRRPNIPGSKLRVSTSPRNYYIQDGKLYLDASTSEAVLLTYHAWHTFPENKDDDDFEFTISQHDEELIRLYVKAAAHGFVRSKAARLDRFKPVGRRDDNPLRPEVQDYYDMYLDKVTERLGGKTHFLHRKR